MPTSTTGSHVGRGRRLSPEARRRQILDAARTLFSARPHGAVTTADVAEAAGVARTLVHHYFGGIDEVFIAVVAEGAAALSDVRTAGTETLFDERVSRNVEAGLEVISANRQTWLAVTGHAESLRDPRIRALIELAIEHNIDRMLTANADLLEDTPVVRHALRCFNAFSTEATRGWLMGDATREQTHALLVSAFRDLVLDTLPAMQKL